MKTISFAATLLGLTLAFASCKKEKIEPTGEVKDYLVQKLQGASDQALVAIMDAVQQALAQMPELNDSLAGQPVGTCPVTTFTPQSSVSKFPATVKLDFGTGCTAKTGNEFAGVITVSVTGNVDSVGTQITATFSGLKVDGNALSGKIEMKTIGAEGIAYQNMEFSVENLALTTNDGKTMSMTALDGSRIQTAGQATTPQNSGQTAYNDDAFDIQFSGEGVNAEGKDFTLETTTDLHRAAACRYITTGKVVYKIGLVTNSADYGDGTCDNELEITVAGVTKTIELP